jgi:hypothetical protein
VYILVRYLDRPADDRSAKMDYDTQATFVPNFGPAVRQLHFSRLVGRKHVKQVRPLLDFIHECRYVMCTAATSDASIICAFVDKRSSTSRNG